ncbi:hypothetical protein IGI04_012175, partial [Brassica rapa subsp. trilocularis]
EPYISPPPIGYPTRDAAGGDPVVAAVETKSKGDDEFSYRRWSAVVSLSSKPAASDDTLELTVSCKLLV